MLKEADNNHVNWYTDAFFIARFLGHLDPNETSIVLDYLFGRVGVVHTIHTIGLVRGISRFLKTTDVQRWVDPFIRGAFNATDSTHRHLIIKSYSDALLLTSSEFDETLRERLDVWKKSPPAADARKQAIMEQFIAAAAIPA